MQGQWLGWFVPPSTTTVSPNAAAMAPSAPQVELVSKRGRRRQVPNAAIGDWLGNADLPDRLERIGRTFDRHPRRI